MELLLSKFRHELLIGEIFDLEAQVVIENWRKEYNQLRAHSSSGNKQSPPEAFEPRILALGVVQ